MCLFLISCVILLVEIQRDLILQRRLTIVSTNTKTWLHRFSQYLKMYLYRQKEILYETSLKLTEQRDI